MAWAISPFRQDAVGIQADDVLLWVFTSHHRVGIAYELNADQRYRPLWHRTTYFRLPPGWPWFAWSNGGSVRTAWVPWAVPTGASAAIACLAWWRWWGRRRKVTEGLCPECGYDLRATTDRCPECGRQLENTMQAS